MAHQFVPADPAPSAARRGSSRASAGCARRSRRSPSSTGTGSSPAPPPRPRRRPSTQRRRRQARLGDPAALVVEQALQPDTGARLRRKNGNDASMRPLARMQQVEHRGERAGAAHRRRAARRWRRARRRSATCACPSGRPAAPRRATTARPSSCSRAGDAHLQRIAHVLDADALDGELAPVGLALGVGDRAAAAAGAGRRVGCSWGRIRRWRGTAAAGQWFTAGRTSTGRAAESARGCAARCRRRRVRTAPAACAGSPCSTNSSGRPSSSTGIVDLRRLQRLEHRAAGAAHDGALLDRDERLVRARQLGRPARRRAA